MKKLLLGLLIVAFLISACTSQIPTPFPPTPTAKPVPPTPTPTAPPTPSEPDYWPTEGWRTSTPEEQGMDSELLAEALDFLQEQDDFNIHSLLIVRNGYIVTDAYFYPFAQASVHDLASVTKSFTASLIGIAIEEGYIEGLQQPVLDLFPERTVANVDANKEAMTVEDLLTMSSGFECINEPDVGEFTLSQMQASPDWAQFTLDLPMAEEPGMRWVYCSSGAHLLSAIIQETTGKSALEFAQEHLFAPLGISDVVWPSGPQGNNLGWGDLHVTPHDMAKLGYLYLHEGEWDGQQVLPATWVAAATTPAISLPPRFAEVSVNDYGYLWWLKPGPSDAYYADGRGGQRVFVLPDQDMVMVTTGGGGRDQYGVLETLLTSYILPAAESATPLPANPDGVALLESGIRQSAQAQAEPEPVPPLPETAQRVSGQTYIIDPNPVGVLAVSLAFQEGEAEALMSVTVPAGPDETLDMEWPIGLDNVYRFSPGDFGLPMGLKGWWESEDVFVVHRDYIGNINQERIRTTFEDDQITIQVQEMTGLGGITLVGRLEEAETEAPASVPPLASLPDGGTVYGDPGGRFSLPLVGDWTPVETDGSYALFTLADPPLELYVVTVESDDPEADVDAALAQIGVDASALSPLLALPDPRWNIYLYSLGDGQGATLAAWALDGATVAVIITGELSVTTAPPAQVLEIMNGFALLPLAEYLEYRPPPAPTSIEAIENLDTIEFYSGRTKLVGRLSLPEGEGPFRAIVHAGGGSGRTTRSQIDPGFLQAAGFAVFSYDKRGAGDSGGFFVEAGVEISEWRLGQLADDALAAVTFLQNLQEINPDQIGLMGGSQNGWIIPLAASRSDAPAFAVIVSGATVSMGEEGHWSELTEDVDPLPQMTESERAELSEKLAGFDGVPGFDPRESIEAMSIPGLWIWGDRDGSQPARESKAILESIITEHDKDFTILYYPDKGHKIRGTHMSEVVDWILAHLEE